MYTIKDLYDLNETIAAKLFEGKTYPWEVLADIGDFIMKLGPTLPKDEFNQIEDNIWVHKTVKIAPTASLTGPLIVDADTEIRPSAFVRGKAIVGKNCVVGNSTELIGKEGQNARLAAKLTGFKIDIKSESQAKEEGIQYVFDDDEYYDDEYYDDEYDAEYDDEYYDDEYDSESEADSEESEEVTEETSEATTEETEE